MASLLHYTSWARAMGSQCPVGRLLGISFPVMPWEWRGRGRARGRIAWSSKRVLCASGLEAGAAAGQSSSSLRTCRNCKQQFDTISNHPRACKFHTGHFGGETKRKFESVYTGGTMDTVGGGDVVQYWHCCGSSDPFDPGCEAAPHRSYDD